MRHSMSLELHHHHHHHSLDRMWLLLHEDAIVLIVDNGEDRLGVAAVSQTGTGVTWLRHCASKDANWMGISKTCLYMHPVR
jgi:hypothetical protein